MAITLRGTSNGTNNNSTSTTISLPAGVAVGDVSIIVAVHANNSPNGVTADVVTPPAGWTTIFNSAGIGAFYRAFQGGDATTGITFTSTRSDWWESSCITYTGLDTSAPIDTSASYYAQAQTPTGAGSFLSYNAPSVNPRFAGSQLLLVYGDARSSGTAITLPAGFTSRVSNASGPNILLADKALTGGTATGDVSTTGGATNNLHAGMQIALKASGASAASVAASYPIIGGQVLIDGLASATTVTVDLQFMNVQNGDIVHVFVAGPGAALVTGVPTGYTAAYSVAGATVYTHTWTTGDATTLTFTYSSSQTSTVLAALVRKAGASTNAVVLDVANTAIAGPATTVTVATPSMTPANASELYLSFIGSDNAGAGTWSSVTSGLVVGGVITSGPCCRFGWLYPSPSPSGAFSATLAVGASSSLGGIAMLYEVSTVFPQSEFNIPANVGQLYPRGGATL